MQGFFSKCSYLTGVWTTAMCFNRYAGFQLHNSNYLILFFHFCGVLLPDQAAHLSERKRNFNERDTHCKIKKYIY